MKKIILFTLIVLTSCAPKKNLSSEKTIVNNILNNWHLDATNTNFENYFNAMAEESVFIGTDVTENWNKKEFMAYSKPYFDKGKAWHFTAIERNIYFSENGKTAWFDELLNTQMKICRGSGTLVKENNQWKIKHYVLSMTVPNENSNEVIKIKTLIEDKIINELKQ